MQSKTILISLCNILHKCTAELCVKITELHSIYVKDTVEKNMEDLFFFNPFIF